MASRDLTVKFLGDSKGLQRAAKDAISSLDGTESKAQAVAKALVKMAEQSDAEMRDAASAADALGAAIGDELRAEVESAGGSIDQYVADLKRAGLTYDEIRQEADALGDALVRMSAQGKAAGSDIKAGADQAQAGLNDMRASGDQSRSVLANLVGNSAQDLGELGGVAGTAGVALGQLAEYAADGNISLSNLTKFAGPMLGVGVAVAAVSAAFAAQKKAAEEMRKEIEALTEVQRAQAEGRYDDAARKLLEQYRDTIPLLREYGLSSEDLVATLKGEQSATEALRAKRAEVARELTYNTQLSIQQKDALRDQQDELDGLLKTLGEAPDAYRQAGDAIRDEDTFVKELTVSLQGGDKATADMAARQEYAASRSEAHRQSTEDLREEVDRYKQSQDRARQAAEDRLEAERELYGFMLSQLDAERAYEAQVDSTDDAITDLTETLADSASTLEDVDDATRDAADAALAQAEAFAASKGAADNSKESVRLQIEELYRLMSTLDPNSPLRQYLLGYIGELQKIPARIDTMLALNIRSGAVTTKDGDFIGQRVVPGESNIVGASGGIVTRPTVATIGEAGPEAVIPLERAPGASPLPAGFGAPITVNVYPRALPTDRELIDLINGVRRRNGDVI